MKSLIEFITESFKDDNIRELFKWLKQFDPKEQAKFKEAFLSSNDPTKPKYLYKWDKVESNSLIEPNTILTNDVIHSLGKTILSDRKQNNESIILVHYKDKDDKEMWGFYKSSHWYGRMFNGEAKIDKWVSLRRELVSDLKKAKDRDKIFVTYYYLNTFDASQLVADRVEAKQGALLTDEDVKKYLKEMIDKRKAALSKIKIEKLSDKVKKVATEVVNTINTLGEIYSVYNSNMKKYEVYREHIIFTMSMCNKLYNDLNDLEDAQEMNDMGKTLKDKLISTEKDLADTKKMIDELKEVK